MYQAGTGSLGRPKNQKMSVMSVEIETSPPSAQRTIAAERVHRPLEAGLWETMSTADAATRSGPFGFRGAAPFAKLDNRLF